LDIIVIAVLTVATAVVANSLQRHLRRAVEPDYGAHDQSVGQPLCLLNRTRQAVHDQPPRNL